VVTIKCILRFSGGGQDQEQEQVTNGVMIDPSGIIVCSNFEIGGNTELLRALSGVEMTITQSDVRVLIGDDTEGVPATIVARDSELDLAWLKIDEQDEAGYTFLDITSGADIKTGSRVYSVTRTSEYFGRAAIITEGRIAAEIMMPRRMLVPDNSLNAEHGIPVLSEDRGFAGLVVLYAPDPEDLDLVEDPSEMVGSFILPASEVLDATIRAREAGSLD
jgi:hypothetical protein